MKTSTFISIAGLASFIYIVVAPPKESRVKTLETTSFSTIPTSGSNVLARFSPNGLYFSLIDHGLIVLYSMKNWTKTTIQLDSIVRDFAFSADDSSIVIQDDEKVSVLSIPDLSLKRQMLYDNSSIEDQLELIAQTDSLIFVSCAAMEMPKIRNRTDWRFALASDSVVIKNIFTGAIYSNILDREGKIVRIRTDRRCRRLVTLAYLDNAVKLWRLPDGILERTETALFDAITAPLLGRSGRFFGYLTSGGLVTIWDLLQDKQIGRFERLGKCTLHDLPDLSLRVMISPAAVTVFDSKTLKPLDQLVYSWDDLRRRDSSPDGMVFSITSSDHVTVYYVNNNNL